MTSIRGAVFCFLAGVLVFAPGTASGHSAATYYSLTWAPADRALITWAFDDGFPSGVGWRARVRDGANQWDAIQQSVFEFEDTGEVAATYDPNCSAWSVEENVVFHRIGDGAGNALATTIVCAKNSDPSKIKNFLVLFDSDEEWWHQTDNPPYSGCTPYCPDLWGIAAHEFGHATGGWLNSSTGKHYSASDNPNLCGDSDSFTYHTMCAMYRRSTSAVPGRGAYWRTLEAHDRDAFDDAY